MYCLANGWESAGGVRDSIDHGTMIVGLGANQILGVLGIPDALEDGLDKSQWVVSGVATSSTYQRLV